MMTVDFKSGTKAGQVISDLFPFYIGLDRYFSVVSIGRSMKKLAPDVIYEGPLEAYFELIKAKHIGAVDLRTTLEGQALTCGFILLHKSSGMRFRCQRYKDDDSTNLFLICSPMLSNFDKEDSFILSINDYALYDNMPDFLFAMQAQDSSINEMEKITQHLVEQRKELIKLNAELKKYASIASHDLQSPLRSIVGFSQLLIRDLKKGSHEQLKEHADMIIGNGVRMKQILDDLLAYGSVDQTNEKKYEFSLDEMMKAVKNNLWADIEASGAVIQFGELPIVKANQTQMIRLFMNLIGNGIKFRHPGMQPIIEVNWKEQEGHFLFEVKDNGIGIEEKYQEKVFRLFQRLHKTEDYPGTGVGLSICRRIAEHHGGAIWIDSVPGEGCTFSFTIEK